MRNIFLFGVFLLLFIAIEWGECLKVRSFFFGLGGGSETEKKDDKSKNSGEESHKPSDTPDHNSSGEHGRGPPGGGGGGEHDHEHEHGPSEREHDHEHGPPGGGGGGHDHEHGPPGGGGKEHEGSDFIPSPPLPPPPPPPPFSDSFSQGKQNSAGDGGSPIGRNEERHKQPGCSCEKEGRVATDCCHEAIFGKGDGAETHNAKITGTITGTITDTTLVTKTGDLVLIKHDTDKPVPEGKGEHPATFSHESEIQTHGGDLKQNLQKQESKGEMKFPNGGVFLPLVLDANTGQYGVELKSIDFLSTSKDEKIKPYDMLIPFLNEQGQLKYVTRRRLRRLVKSGLSRGLSETSEEGDKGDAGDDKDDKKELASALSESEREEKKDKEHEDKKEGSGGIADLARNAAKSAKDLLQEAESVLTGGSLFESPEKEKEGRKGDRDEDKNKDEEKGNKAEKDKNKDEEKKDDEDEKEEEKKDVEGEKEDKEESKRGEDSDDQEDVASTRESEEEEEEQ